MGRRCEDLAEQYWPDSLQEMQDSLTYSADLPVLFVHPSGRPAAACEDLSDFCRHFTRAVSLSRPCLSCTRLANEDQDAALSPQLRLMPTVHFCPLGLVDMAVPIRSAGEVLGYLVTAQVRPDCDPDLAELAFAPPEVGECAEFVAGRRSRSLARMETVAAGLSTVAWLTGALAATRRRNLRLGERLREQSCWLQQHVTTDAVTGVANRRCFVSMLEAEVIRAKRYKRSLSVAVLDIEGFGRTNEDFGHEVGDAVLRAVAGCLAYTIRQTDLVARIGGDEFAVLFPETDRPEAMIALSRVHRQVSELNASGELPVEVRLNLGIVDRTGGHEDMLLTAIAAERNARALALAVD